MALSIKSEEADRLARALALFIGEDFATTDVMPALGVPPR